ncbi:hypothetical protein CEXT_333521 [Caerostris extrusa]|uniref:Uncharacterized protein n=1 Tax=Caerostris extrusa TaxID=172846 RepID=A0AAV4RU91_CAEEX|nr:hypothetical protein CEXT_333521 [Caerostris extrusa]
MGKTWGGVEKNFLLRMEMNNQPSNRLGWRDKNAATPHPPFPPSLTSKPPGLSFRKGKSTFSPGWPGKGGKTLGWIPRHISSSSVAGERGIWASIHRGSINWSCLQSFCFHSFGDAFCFLFGPWISNHGEMNGTERCPHCRVRGSVFCSGGMGVCCSSSCVFD